MCVENDGCSGVLYYNSNVLSQMILKICQKCIRLQASKVTNPPSDFWYCSSWFNSKMSFTWALFTHRPTRKCLTTSNLINKSRQCNQIQRNKMTNKQNVSKSDKSETHRPAVFNCKREMGLSWAHRNRLKFRLSNIKDYDCSIENVKTQ